MKSKMLVLASLVLLTATSCNKNRLKGEGSTISDTRSLSSFTRIEGNGSNNVKVIKDSQYKVIVTGYENLVPAFETEISNGTLKLQYKDKFWNVRNNNVSIEVHMPDVKYFLINGSGNGTISDGFDGSEFEGRINGSGTLNVNNSTFTSLTANINGSGDFNAQTTTCENAHAKISGSGNININAKKVLHAQISGSGNINYWGNPVISDLDISGSGNVRKKG